MKPCRCTQASVHYFQRGFVRGRKLLDNRFDIDITLVIEPMSGAARCGVALFDVAAAFPSLE